MVLQSCVGLGTLYNRPPFHSVSCLRAQFCDHDIWLFNFGSPSSPCGVVLPYQMALQFYMCLGLLNNRPTFHCVFLSLLSSSSFCYHDIQWFHFDPPSSLCGVDLSYQLALQSWMGLGLLNFRPPFHFVLCLRAFCDHLFILSLPLLYLVMTLAFNAFFGIQESFIPWMCPNHWSLWALMNRIMSLSCRISDL